jgi:CHAD domain-containing protein
MVAVHREVERKYDVGESFRLPVLVGCGPVVGVEGPDEVVLEATYYDTADHRLAAARTTLRRRTGGSDAGWHLKLPVADGSRDEVREPLEPSGQPNAGEGPNGTVPGALRALARAATRGADLGPVARLRTARSVYRLTGTGPDGAAVVLAEVADDRVVAEAFGSAVEVTVWRELEVELVDGDPDLLGLVEGQLLESGARRATSASKLARALGARLVPGPASPRLRKRSPAGLVVGAALRDHVEELIGQDPRVRLDEPDSVHQMRVATRRLRSLLAAYRPLYDRSVTEPVRAELKWLGGVLGAARDAEVLRDRLRTAAAEEPDDLLLGPVAARLDTEFGKTYREAHEQVVAALDSPRYLGLLESLDALVTSPPWTDLADRTAARVVPRRVRSSWRRVRDAARQAAAAPVGRRDEALHEVRKAAKRARYASEAARTVFGSPAKRFGSEMKAVQTHLGLLQDSVAAREVLRPIAVRAFLAGENCFTYGRLHAREQAHGEAVTQGFDPVWATASSRRLRRWLR